MKPIRLIQQLEDLPAGLTFQPVSAHAWATSYNGRVIAIKREDYEDEVYAEHFEEVREA